MQSNIRKWIKKTKKSPVKYFYPTAILKFAKISKDQLVQELKELETVGIIKIFYEGRCPDCFRELKTLSEFPDKNITVECVCGEIELTPDNFFTKCQLIK